MSRVYVWIIILCFAAGCADNSTGRKSEDTKVAADELQRNIYRAGDSMLAAFKRKDWHAFVKYNHPNMTSRMGGPNAFASFMRLQMKQIPDTAIKSIALGKILQVVKAPTDLQCVVEQNMKMQMEGISMDKTTYLVGESLDEGRTWTFFDASTKTSLSAKDIKPNLSNELIIPESKKEIER